MKRAIRLGFLLVLLLACLGCGLAAYGWRYYGNNYAGLAGQNTEAKPDVTVTLQVTPQEQR